MVWRDYAVLAALIVIMVGNKMKMLESEAAQYIGVIMVTIGAVAVAALWPKGIA